MANRPSGLRRNRALTEETAATAAERRRVRFERITAPTRKSFSDCDLRSIAMLPLRMKSQRCLINTAPVTCIGEALESVKSQVSPKLFQGIEIRKVSKRGTVVPRVLTLSDDLFKLIVSHHKGGRAEGVTDRLRYQSFRAYASSISVVTGMPVQAKRDMRVIDVSDILFVQSGFVGSRKLEACMTIDLDPTKVISIFHKNVKTMDFLVESGEDVNAVLSAIRIIREIYDASKAKVTRDALLLRYAWYDIDWNKSGLIKQWEFLQLLGRINIYIKKEKAITIFRHHTTAKHLKRGSTGSTTTGSMRLISMMTHHNPSGITFNECLDILRKIKLELCGGHLMTDIIFNELFGDNDVITTEEFMVKFLREKQQERNATIDDARRVFSHLNRIEISGSRFGVDDSIDRERFGEYLFSSMNDLFDPWKQKLDVSTLTRPFPSYWINSSHNTYLTADQLQSESSVQMYAVAMQR